MILSKLASVAFYLVIFLFVFIFAFLRKKTDKKFFGIISVLIPAIAVAARFKVGTDSAAYITMFDDISSEPINYSIKRILDFSMEPTAVFLIRLLSNFAFSYFTYFFSYSLLTFSFLYLFSKKVSKERFWLIFGALAMIMLPYCINGMRQAAAVSIFSILLVNVFKEPRSIIKNALLFVFAFSVHFSTLLLIPALLLILLYRRYGFRDIAILTIGIALVTLAIFPKAISIALDSGILPYKYADTLEVYEGTLLNFDFVIFLGLSCLLLLTRKHIDSQQKDLEDFTTLAILCNLFYAGLGFYSAYIGRMSDYFWPFATLGIWLGLNRFKDSQNFKTTLYIAAIAGYFVAVYFIMGNSEIIPFRFLS